MIMMESTTYLCIIEEFPSLGQGLGSSFESLNGWGIFSKREIEATSSLLARRKTCESLRGITFLNSHGLLPRWICGPTIELTSTKS